MGSRKENDKKKSSVVMTLQMGLTPLFEAWKTEAQEI